MITPGMKVEAVDRANPNMTCVATIADVNRGQRGEEEYGLDAGE